MDVTERVPSAFRVPRGISRVSLGSGLSGVPLVFLFFRGLSQPEFHEVRSIEHVEALRERASHPSDRQLWESLSAFFRLGGKLCRVLAYPLTGEGLSSAERGMDGGAGRRTGIHLIREWGERADLLLIPQLFELAEESAFSSVFYELAQIVAATEGLFWVVDLPRKWRVERLMKELTPLECADAGIFHPWLLNEGRAIPSSFAVAAWIQTNDEKCGPADFQSRIVSGEGFSPLYALTPIQRANLQNERVNCFHLSPHGLFTNSAFTFADKSNWRNRLIPLRRSAVKVRQAAEEVCEPYVLEAVNEELPVLVENSLQNFFRSVRRMFHNDTNEPFTTEVKSVSQEGEEKLHVMVSYVLPHSLEKLTLSFVA
jgi:hypothetical protein